MTTPPLRVAELLLVAAGGAVGALARHAIDVAAPEGLFPWPTLGINVVGALVLGLLPALAVVRRSRRLAVTLGPGVLGGFTTVSTFAGEVRELLDSDRLALAGAYLTLTLAAGLAAAAIGLRIAHRPEPEDEVG